MHFSGYTKKLKIILNRTYKAKKPKKKKIIRITNAIYYTTIMFCSGYFALNRNYNNKLNKTLLIRSMFRKQGL